MRTKVLIFGHYFDFKAESRWLSEPLFSDSEVLLSNDNKTIAVLECPDDVSMNNFPFQTTWVEMSGQEVRYYSLLAFEKTYQTCTWALEVKDAVTLIWDASDKKIGYIKGKNYTPQRLLFWIFHTFFPIVLELERVYRILHVGSVEIKGKPVLFSAPSFGGKSTLTDYFIQKGHTMLCDDTMAIDKMDDVYYAVASYPFHRPFRQPEVLGYPVENFATKPKAVQAVYVLEKSDSDAPVMINELRGIEKFKAFHYSSFIDFSFMKQERFAFFTEMAKHVPVYSITVPWNLDRLDEVYGVIVGNSRE